MRSPSQSAVGRPSRRSFVAGAVGPAGTAAPLGGGGATAAPRSRPGTARFGADDLFARLDLESPAGCGAWQSPGLVVQDIYRRTLT
jgi:ABC-type thiamine transport system ATPase subunit